MVRYISVAFFVLAFSAFAFAESLPETKIDLDLEGVDFESDPEPIMVSQFQLPGRESIIEDIVPVHTGARMAGIQYERGEDQFDRYEVGFSLGLYLLWQFNDMDQLEVGVDGTVTHSHFSRDTYTEGATTLIEPRFETAYFTYAITLQMLFKLNRAPETDFDVYGVVGGDYKIGRWYTDVRYYQTTAYGQLKMIEHEKVGESTPSIIAGLGYSVKLPETGSGLDIRLVYEYPTDSAYRKLTRGFYRLSLGYSF